MAAPFCPQAALCGQKRSSSALTAKAYWRTIVLWRQLAPGRGLEPTLFAALCFPVLNGQYGPLYAAKQLISHATAQHWMAENAISFALSGLIGGAFFKWRAPGMEKSFRRSQKFIEVCRKYSRSYPHFLWLGPDGEKMDAGQEIVARYARRTMTPA